MFDAKRKMPGEMGHTFLAYDISENELAADVFTEMDVVYDRV